MSTRLPSCWCVRRAGGAGVARGDRQAQAQRPGQPAVAAVPLGVQLGVAQPAVFVAAGVHRLVLRRGPGHQRAVHAVRHVLRHQHQRAVLAHTHHQLEHGHAHGHRVGQHGAGAAGAATLGGLGVADAPAPVAPRPAPAFAADAQAQHPLARPGWCVRAADSRPAWVRRGPRGRDARRARCPRGPGRRSSGAGWPGPSSAADRPRRPRHRRPTSAGPIASCGPATGRVRLRAPAGGCNPARRSACRRPPAACRC